MLSLIASLWGKAFSFLPDFQVLSSDKFEHHFKTRKVYSVLIDARSPEAFEQSHLPNSINVPFSESFLKDLDTAMDAKDAPKSILLFVYAGDAEGTAALKSRLERAVREKEKVQYKYRLVHFLDGGFAALP